MSKTLPAAITAGKGGDSERVILVRLIPEAGDAWSEYDWATRGLTVTSWEGGADKVFSGGVLVEDAFSVLTENVDVTDGGNVGTISGCTLRVANPEFSGSDRFDETNEGWNSDVERAYGLFEGRTVELYLVFWTGSNPAYTDVLMLRKFIVTDIEFEYGTYVFKLENAYLKRHKEIPSAVVTREDYTYAPEYSLGKIIPLLYGYLCGGAYTLNYYMATPMLLVEVGDGKYLISANESMYISSPEAFLFHQETDKFGRAYPYPDYGMVMTSGRPSYLVLLDSTNAHEMRELYYGNATIKGDKTSPFSTDLKDLMSPQSANGVSVPTAIYVKFPLPSDLGVLVRDGDPSVSIVVHFGTVTGSGTIRYWNAEYDNGVGAYSTGIAYSSADSDTAKTYSLSNDKSAHGNADDQSDQNDRWTVQQLMEYQFGVERSSGTVIVNLITIRLQNLYLTSTPKAIIGGMAEAHRKEMDKAGRSIEETPSDKLCMHAQGGVFGSWIDEEGRSNVFDDNDLIDGGVWHIESMLRDELGLTSDDINMDAFDSIGAYTGPRPYHQWRFGTVISRRKNSLEHIRDFCRQAGIIYYTDYQGKEKPVALTAGTSVKTIDRSSILEGTIKTSWSPLDKVYNQFKVHYDKHWITGAYLEMVYLNESGSNFASFNNRGGEAGGYVVLCQESQADYNITKELQVNCFWGTRVNCSDAYFHYVRRFICWLAEWFCYRKLIVEFETALDHIDLELGDQVKIDHTLIPSNLNNSAKFMVISISHDLNEDRLKFKLIQIPDLLA